MDLYHLDLEVISHAISMMYNLAIQWQKNYNLINETQFLDQVIMNRPINSIHKANMMDIQNLEPTLEKEFTMKNEQNLYQVHSITDKIQGQFKQLQLISHLEKRNKDHKLQKEELQYQDQAHTQLQIR